MYDFVHKQAPGVAPFASPYHAMLEALDRVANLRVTGLLIEVTERAVYECIETSPRLSIGSYLMFNSLCSLMMNPSNSSSVV